MKDKKIFITGNEAMGLAAIKAGCKFYAGYPITPQNELTAFMARELPKAGGVFVQAESELAAINMIIGAASVGARCMTSSSSPGISLKQEGISYIAGMQLPCLIINVMRGGPGLGNIAPSQSDYFQATKGGGHGDYRLIVLAPNSVQEAYDLVILGFNLADKYRNPTMILLDAMLGQMSESVILKKPKILKVKKDWKIDIKKDRPQRIIRSFFIKEGFLEKHNLILKRKYERIKKKEQRAQDYRTQDAKILIVSFGSQSRISKEAVEILRKKGIKAGLFRPITLWPFPEDSLKRISKKVKFILVVEQNFGQMVEDVRLAIRDKKPVYFFGRAGGGIPTATQIVNFIKKLL